MLHPVANPPNPYHRFRTEWLDEPPEDERIQVFEETARSILSENDSPDLGFKFSVNPYRGCFHACAYCYARPYHQMLDFGAGTDFERKIVVKTNAATLLARELRRPQMRGMTVAFSGITDCYQPLEAHYELTRACLEVCLHAGNPIVVITKGVLVRRDLELLVHLAERRQVRRVYVSIPMASRDDARRLEPGVATPAARFAAMAALAAASVPVGVAVAPVIPGLSEAGIPEVLERARAAGATRAFFTMLRLPAEVETVFTERLTEAYPERAGKVLAALRDVRGGRLNDARFGARMRGEGARAAAIAQLFRVTCQRLGLASDENEVLDPLPPRRDTQLELFAPPEP